MPACELLNGALARGSIQICAGARARNADVDIEVGRVSLDAKTKNLKKEFMPFIFAHYGRRLIGREF